MLDTLESLRERLAPHYDVERQIGAGGMARVYLAVEQHPHRRVAIKVIDPELSNRLLRERFIREVDLSSKLSHPHIVPIFSAGEVDGLFYYVMPYVEGESLRHRLLRERKLPLEAALHITRDVADALAFAHAQGIIHRDIKPENILLSGDHAIVADFGIARAISAAGALTITQTGQSIGSPGYMSPEQALGSGDLDARTDICSLGCVLFEALASEPPVPSLAERLIHNWGALESCDALRGEEGGVARAVKHAISKALAPLPDDRFATAAGFAAALGGSAHRTSVPTRGIFAGRRGRRIALVGAPRRGGRRRRGVPGAAAPGVRSQRPARGRGRDRKPHGRPRVRQSRSHGGRLGDSRAGADRSRRGCPLDVCDERVAGVGRTWSRPPRRRGASGTGAGDRRRHGGVGRLLPAGGQRPVSGPDLGGEGRHGPAGARSRRRAAGSAARCRRSPAPACHGRARDAVRLPAQPL